MSNRGQHLFEAFKTGPAASPNTGSAPGGSASSSAPVGLPLFAPRGGVTLRKSQVQLLVLTVALLVVVAFLLGRASVAGVAAAASTGAEAGTTQAPAAQPPAEPQPAPQAPAAPAQVDPNPRTPLEHALHDPANRYTVKVSDNPAKEDFIRKAQEAAAALTQLGVEACAFNTGTRVIILAGAAAESGQLGELRDRIRALSVPLPGSKPAQFGDAYVDKIDKFIHRTK